MEYNSNQQQYSKQLTGNDSARKEETTLILRREAIGRADKVYDKKTRKWRLHKRSQRKKSGGLERFVIVSARVFTFEGSFSGRYEISILGRLLCEELNRIFPSKHIEFPYDHHLSDFSIMAMYHGLPILKRRLDGLEENDTTCEDLRFELNAGVAFINEHWSHVIEDLKLTPKGLIKFDMLWTLFFPGCLLYSVDKLKEPRSYRLLTYEYGEDDKRNPEFSLIFDHLDYNGQQIGHRVRIHTIREFKSSMIIQDLPLYPISLHPDCDGVRQQLLQRAKRTLCLKGRHIQNYHGHALECNEDIQNIRKDSQNNGQRYRKFNSNGRVMIDPVLCDQLHADGLEELIKRQDFLGDSFEPLTDDTLDEDQKLSDVIWDTSVFDSVEIDPLKKAFLQTLVESHVALKAGSFDDIVRGKGKGLIGLLCGPPGVGKTLTAEAVAEVAKRPLIVVSSGEMGSNVVTVERSLKAEIDLAEAWNAVLLLDEADVFMAERDDAHIERNTVTSVFLRELEYYRGIILLTTNRLTSIDSAFQSRIHFCFHYDDLDLSAKAQVWKTFLTKAEATEGIRVDITEEQRQTLALRDLNGRQIKNIVTITRLYALQTKQPITLELVQTAAGFSQFAPPMLKRKRSVRPAEDGQLSTKRQKNGDCQF
ncbi:hypothetical protein ACHAQJ_007815 [Trichoderma viride]